MGLQDFNISHSVEDRIAKARSVASKAFDNISGNINSTLSGHHFRESFVGISKTGLEDLKTGLEKYIQTVQSIVDGFNEDGDISSSLQGYPLGAAKEFIKAIKYLLNSYISSMRMEKKEIDEALKNYDAAASKIQKVVSQDASSIRQTADKIKLDE